MASRILIAENDTGARRQVSGWLEMAGFACASAATGEALSEARRQPPDVAVVSVGTPEDAGMWVVRSLRAQATPPGVVVMSTTPGLDVVQTAARLGAADCLPWPSSEKTIVDAVKRAAEWRSALSTAFGREKRLRDEIDRGREEVTAMLAAVQPDIAQSVLVALLESRLPETYDHSHRVARSAAALARTMQLAPIRIRDVRAAALLHEIGKVAFPARLLGSGSVLSNDEVVALQRHVEIAADLLAGVETLSHLAPVVGASQERYDGTGQPGRRAGDAIPLGARIIAVADVYDRLTARRSHEDPMSHDDASVELVRMAGSHLDPDAVRAWMNLVESYRCY